MRVVGGARTDWGRAGEFNEDVFLTEPPVGSVGDGMDGYRAGATAGAPPVVAPVDQ